MEDDLHPKLEVTPFLFLSPNRIIRNKSPSSLQHLSPHSVLSTSRPVLLRRRKVDVLVCLLPIDEQSILENRLIARLWRFNGDGTKLGVAFWDIPISLSVCCLFMRLQGN